MSRPRQRWKVAAKETPRKGRCASPELARTRPRRIKASPVATMMSNTLPATASANNPSPGRRMNDHASVSAAAVTPPQVQIEVADRRRSGFERHLQIGHGDLAAIMPGGAGHGRTNNACLMLAPTPRVAAHYDSWPNNALRQLPAPSFAPAQGRTPSVAPAKLLPCLRTPYRAGSPFRAKFRPFH